MQHEELRELVSQKCARQVCDEDGQLILVNLAKSTKITIGWCRM